MIRKAITVLLTLATLGAAAIFVYSYTHDVQTTPMPWDPPFNCDVIKGRINVRIESPGLALPWTRFAGISWGSVHMNDGTKSATFLSVHVPLLYVVVVLVTCPTIAFIRGPLRRWRRRRKGLCVKCGYNLTLNVSGVCPECGTPISRR